MSDNARNSDTFNDGWDDGPEWIPEIGERVELDHAAIAYTGTRNNLRYFGRIEAWWHEEGGGLEFSVRMENNPFGDRPWFVCATLEELDDAEEQV